MLCAEWWVLLWWGVVRWELAWLCGFGWCKCGEKWCRGEGFKDLYLHLCSKQFSLQICTFDNLALEISTYTCHSLSLQIADFHHLCLPHKYMPFTTFLYKSPLFTTFTHNLYFSRLLSINLCFTRLHTHIIPQSDFSWRNQASSLISLSFCSWASAFFTLASVHSILLRPTFLQPRKKTSQIPPVPQPTLLCFGWPSPDKSFQMQIKHVQLPVSLDMPFKQSWLYKQWIWYLKNPLWSRSLL